MPDLENADDQGLEVALDESAEQDTEDQGVVETEGDDTKPDVDTESEEDDSETTTDGDEGEEDALEFSEWAKQFDGMPDGIKSEDDLATSYVEALKEMKRAQTGHQQLQQLDAALKARGLTGGVNSLLAGDIPQFGQQPATAPQPPPEGKTYFDYAPAKGVVDQMIEDGRIRDTEESPTSVTSHKWLAQLMDGAVGPQLKKAEEVYTVAMNSIGALAQKIRNLEWTGLGENIRKSFDRDDLDKILNMNLPEIDTYEKAARFHAFNKPDLLTQLTNKAQERGKEEARKKLKRSNAMRRGKPVSKTRTYDYSKYIRADGEWDEAAMSRLTPDQRIEMLEAYQREHGQ